MVVSSPDLASLLPKFCFPLPQSFCPQICPGCAHRAKTEEESLKQKADFLQQQLAPWQALIMPIQGPMQRTAYRDRVCLNVQEQALKWQWGMIIREQFLLLTDCPLQTPAINRLLNLMMEILNGARISAEELPLRFILINGRQIGWVVKQHPQAELLRKMIPILEEFKPQLAQDSASFWWHWNPSCGKRVTAKKTWQKLWGREYGITAEGLHYGPMSFRQVHPTMYQEALQKAATYFWPGQISESQEKNKRQNQVMVDLYCGIGTSIYYWRQQGIDEEQILGVELNGDAITHAAENFPQAVFLRGTPEQRIPQILPWAQGKQREESGKEVYLFVNPPRLGLSSELIKFIGQDLRPAKMVYLSCSPGTLARDLQELASWGICPQKIFPYDFFPQTPHVETLVWLGVDQGA